MPQRKPDYELWRDIETAELWEFIALSIDVEPDAVWLESDAVAPPDFTHRLRAAVSALEVSLPALAYGSGARSPLLASVFWPWTATKRWNVPRAFADLVALATRDPHREEDDDYHHGWSAIATDLETHGVKLGKSDPERNARRRLVALGIEWERKERGGWVPSSTAGAAKGAEIRLRKSVLHRKLGKA